MLDRDVDAAIVEEIYGWTLCDIPSDAKGENACQILSPGGELPAGWVPPPLGPVHRGALAPEFTGDLVWAIRLANRVGLVFSAGNIPVQPHLMAKEALRVHRENTAREEQRK